MSDKIYEEIKEEERRSLERRMSHLENNLAMHSMAIDKLVETTELKMDHMEEKIDKLVDRAEKPINWTGWIGAIVTTLVVMCGAIYTAYVKPVEVRLTKLETMVITLLTESNDK